MKHLVRALVVAALVLQGWRAVRWADYEKNVGSIVAAWEDRDPETAFEYLDKARAFWDRDPEVWTWLGEVSLYHYRNPPEGSWSPEASEDLLRRAWAGYAGAVLRCPLDSWSWSGLADVALRMAMRRDSERGVDLAELDRRAEGTLDGYHAVAFGAARLALEIRPTGYQELDVLAKIHESTGALERAREAYVQSARMMPAPSFHTWASGRRLVGDLYEAILQGLGEGVASAPAFEKSMLNLDVARFARAQADLRTAFEYVSAAEATAREPYWTFQAAWEKAHILEEMGRIGEAIEALRVARGTGFDRAAVSRKLGMLRARAGDPRDACADLRDALREMAQDADLRLETARVCEEALEHAMAEQILREGFTDPADDLRLAHALLEFHRRRGRARVAAALARAWARDFPEQEEFRRWAERLDDPEAALPGPAL